ncbi:BON domain-containing protein [Microvirga soli]|uniref:BON domain-containing protein n=1 Tax=Microvirga soli TaxID=1854496 RepID=UPI0019202F0E|nr:BON domain-containing protein [Microvirga soli]
MADQKRSSSSGFRTADEDLSEYLRNEYRAEEGAYLERRPAHARYGHGEEDPRLLDPRLPGRYYGEGSFPGHEWVTTRPEPLRREEDGFERRDPSTSPRGARDYSGKVRYGTSVPSRTAGQSSQRDREAAHKLLRAAEAFYEDLTRAVGLESHDDLQQDYRGRGPRNYRRPDDRILDDVGHRLTEDGHVDASDIEVSVKSQEVILSGTVSTPFEKRRAEDIADTVSGVTHVQNNLRIRPL